METIDHIYYINLDHRTDRESQMQDVLSSLSVEPSKVTRVQAIYTPPRGHIGCILSHIKALELFLKSPHKNCIIFEDDYTPLKPDTFWDTVRLLTTHSIEYDFVMLAYNELKSEETNFDWLRKVNFSWTSSGYIINKQFAHILYNRLVEECSIIDFTGVYLEKYNYCCVDYIFTKMMPDYKWYCLYPRLGVQRQSYSDVQLHVTNYNA